MACAVMSMSTNRSSNVASDVQAVMCIQVEGRYRIGIVCEELEDEDIKLHHFFAFEINKITDH